jgi:hypothetical protein
MLGSGEVELSSAPKSVPHGVHQFWITTTIENTLSQYQSNTQSDEYITAYHGTTAFSWPHTIRGRLLMRNGARHHHSPSKARRITTSRSESTLPVAVLQQPQYVASRFHTVVVQNYHHAVAADILFLVGPDTDASTAAKRTHTVVVSASAEKTEES